MQLCIQGIRQRKLTSRVQSVMRSPNICHGHADGSRKLSGFLSGSAIQRNLSKTTSQGTFFRTWSLLPGGLLIQGHLIGNSIPWCWFQWSSRTGGRLIRVVALTGFTVLSTPLVVKKTGWEPTTGTLHHVMSVFAVSGHHRKGIQSCTLLGADIQSTSLITTLGGASKKCPYSRSAIIPEVSLYVLQLEGTLLWAGKCCRYSRIVVISAVVISEVDCTLGSSVHFRTNPL